MLVGRSYALPGAVTIEVRKRGTALLNCAPVAAPSASSASWVSRSTSAHHAATSPSTTPACSTSLV
ncbi:hypothetical protein B7C42_08388 [Nocardia cerradoensis]|uniref:Uncharacterized protein n=1 Tax=Nocardia cerradoensis TaxID=85688 RepID=A0A231GSG5_9NOCA|nr:hypothetical protein B7C42_08388 [Nocardia cerradoensis]